MKTQTRIVIKNQITGEEMVFLGQGSYKAPWKLDRVETVRVPGEPGEPETEESLARKSKLAVWATKHGLPLPQFLDAARWLLQKDCAFCQLATQVMRAIDSMGDAKAEHAITRILAAKDRGDHAELEKIKKELCPSETPTSPQQS